MPQPDPVAELLRVVDERAAAARAPDPVMGTVLSLDPFTVLLDTGQTIVDPAVFTSTLEG